MALGQVAWRPNAEACTNSKGEARVCLTPSKMPSARPSGSIEYALTVATATRALAEADLRIADLERQVEAQDNDTSVLIWAGVIVAGFIASGVLASRL